MKMTTRDKEKVAKAAMVEHWLSLLTPTQFALLFPSHKNRPSIDIGKSTSGATALGGETSTGAAPGAYSGGGRGGGGHGGRGYGRQDGGISGDSGGPKQSLVYKPSWLKRAEKESGVIIQEAQYSGAKILGGSTIPKTTSKETLDALNKVAAENNLKPSAISMMINLESEWGTKSKTGSYYGLTQIGGETFSEAGGRLGGVTYDEFKVASPGKQIEVYGDWLAHYKFKEQAQKYGIDFSKMTAPQQAAYLQGMQFAPNAEDWKREFSKGNYDYMTTSSPQARALGSTSINDMAAYYQGVENRDKAIYEASSIPDLPNKTGQITPEPGLRPGDNVMGPFGDLESQMNDRVKTYYKNLSENQKKDFGSMVDKVGMYNLNTWANEAPTAEAVGEKFFIERGNIEGVNPKVVNLLKEASRDLPEGWKVKTISGKDARSTGTKNHPGGLAVDVIIEDENGKNVPHNKNSSGWKHYEQLYRSVNIRGKEMYPDDEFIWGGPWNSDSAGRGDPMHYQLVDKSVRGSSEDMRYTMGGGLAPGHEFIREGGQLTPEERGAWDQRVVERMAAEREEIMAKSSATPVPGPAVAAPGAITPEPGPRPQPPRFPTKDDPFYGATFPKGMPKPNVENLSPGYRRWAAAQDRSKLNKILEDRWSSRNSLEKMFAQPSNVEKAMNENFAAAKAKLSTEELSARTQEIEKVEASRAEEIRKYNEPSSVEAVRSPSVPTESATPVEAAPAQEAPKEAPKEEPPKMATGGKVQTKDDSLLVSKRTGKPYAQVHSGEKMDITPAHRLSAKELEGQRKTKQEKAEVAIESQKKQSNVSDQIQKTIKQSMPKQGTLPRFDHTAHVQRTPSSDRAYDSARFILDNPRRLGSKDSSNFGQ